MLAAHPLSFVPHDRTLKQSHYRVFETLCQKDQRPRFGTDSVEESDKCAVHVIKKCLICGHICYGPAGHFLFFFGQDPSFI